MVTLVKDNHVDNYLKDILTFVYYSLIVKKKDQKRRGNQSKGVQLQQNDERVHIYKVSVDFMGGNGYEMIHCTYLPPSDYFLFPNLSKDNPTAISGPMKIPRQRLRSELTQNASSSSFLG